MGPSKPISVELLSDVQTDLREAQVVFGKMASCVPVVYGRLLQSMYGNEACAERIRFF